MQESYKQHQTLLKFMPLPPDWNIESSCVCVSSVSRAKERETFTVPLCVTRYENEEKSLVIISLYTTLIYGFKYLVIIIITLVCH